MFALALAVILCSNTNSPENQSGLLKTASTFREVNVSEPNPTPKGCVYQARNKVNGKLYVGKTTNGLSYRRSEHIRHARAKCRRKHHAFHRAIRKYGADAFEWIVLFSSDDEAELNAKEMEFIKLIGTRAPVGYNLTDGGEGTKGHVVSQECREQISAQSKGRVTSDETRAKQRAAILGQRRSDETKEKLRKLQLGRKRSETTREKMRIISLARRRSPETRAKMRQSHIGYRHTEASFVKMRAIQSNRTPEHRAKLGAAFRGRKVSEATREKLREVARRRKHRAHHNTKGYSRQGNGFRVECNTVDGRIRKYVRTEEEAQVIVAKARSGFTT